MVKIEIKTYKKKNNLNWLALYLSIKIEAIYEKNPLVSKTIEIKEIEINKINIFKGFIFEFDVNISMNLPLSNNENVSKITAINKTGI